MYRDRGSALPIPVKISVSLKHDDAKASKPLVTTNMMLRKMNAEVTTLRFWLDGDGKLEADSLNSLVKGLTVAAVQGSSAPTFLLCCLSTMFIFFFRCVVCGHVLLLCAFC